MRAKETQTTPSSQELQSHGTGRSGENTMTGRPRIIAGIILIMLGIPLLILLFPLGYSIGPLLIAIGAIMVLYGWRIWAKQRLQVSTMRRGELDN